jgi:trehalose-phosphatase
VKFISETELTQWALASKKLWLFLDYDGTLADFAPTPDHIEPDPHIIQIIKWLVSKPTVHITVLSGRRLEHIRQLLPVPGIFLAGAYGIELLTPAGEALYRAELVTIRHVLEAVKPAWADVIRGRNGFYLEDKGWTLALHARFADGEEAEQVITQARQLLDGLVDRFRILGGHKFLEIAPSLASKRDTVTYLLNQYPISGARLLYIGDDDKDEEAFPVIHANGGVAIKVFQPSQRGQPTSADFFFDSPIDTLQWLEELAQLKA